jgi:RNA polymerase sigma-70 factor (ECF subfamily)
MGTSKALSLAGIWARPPAITAPASAAPWMIRRHLLVCKRVILVVMYQILYFSSLSRQPFRENQHLIYYMDVSQLIKEAKLGSAAAQKCLFDLFADRMFLLCRRYVKSREHAEEILQDGFYKFFKGLPAFTYEGAPGLTAWLKRIMINECLMSLRRKNAFVMVSESAAEEIPWQEDALDKLSTVEIFYLVVQLPVGYRTVFNLYVLEGMNHREIAQALDISEGTSKSQLSKAKTLLQKMLIQKDNDYVKRNIQ